MANVLQNKFVINLSKHKLSEDEITVLSKGMNFCPTPGALDPGEYRTDLDSLHRRLRLRYHFRKEDGTQWIPPDVDNIHNHSPFEHKISKNPPSLIHLELQLLRQ
jgi:hypothetical protein